MKEITITTMPTVMYVKIKRNHLKILGDDKVWMGVLKNCF